MNSSNQFRGILSLECGNDVQKSVHCIETKYKNDLGSEGYTANA